MTGQGPDSISIDVGEVLQQSALLIKHRLITACHHQQRPCQCLRSAPQDWSLKINTALSLHLGLESHTLADAHGAHGHHTAPEFRYGAAG